MSRNIVSQMKTMMIRTIIYVAISESEREEKWQKIVFDKQIMT